MQLIVCRIADNLIATNRLGNSIPFCLSDIIRCAFLRLSAPPAKRDRYRPVSFCWWRCRRELPRGKRRHDCSEARGSSYSSEAKSLAALCAASPDHLKNKGYPCLARPALIIIKQGATALCAAGPDHLKNKEGHPIGCLFLPVEVPERTAARRRPGRRSLAQGGACNH